MRAVRVFDRFTMCVCVQLHTTVELKLNGVSAEIIESSDGKFRFYFLCSFGGRCVYVAKMGEREKI